MHIPGISSTAVCNLVCYSSNKPVDYNITLLLLAVDHLFRAHPHRCHHVFCDSLIETNLLSCVGHPSLFIVSYYRINGLATHTHHTKYISQCSNTQTTSIFDSKFVE